MARIFLYIVAGVISIVLLIVILLNVFQDQALKIAFVPGESFDAYKIPPAPDYSDPESWAKSREGDGKADIFYIHPTTFLRPTGWNAAIDDRDATLLLDKDPLKHQASIFTPAGRLYAPRYRQAAFGAFLEDSEDADQALELAYTDIERAFDHYIRLENQGRPFLIASHSQGAKHGLRLLKEHILGRPAESRLVAAYLVGWPVPDDGQVPVCDNPDQTGCILSWSTFGKGGDPSGLLEKAPGGRIVCTNPLSWQADTMTAEAALNIGAIGKSIGKGPLPDPAANLTDARCGEDGILYITPPLHPDFQRDIWPGLNYHLYDYHLFYMNVRENAARRIEAFAR